MPPFILIAIIMTSTAMGPNRPVAVAVEFSGLVQCEAARKNLFGQKKIEVLYSACERK